MRGFKMPRESYVPKGSTKISDKQSDAVVYIYERAGKVYAIAFHGKADKPDWHHSFKSAASREAKIAQHFDARQAWLASRAERKAQRQTEGRGLEVGDVLRASWGYDQTNVDYYEVTALVGARMVELREIAQASKETAWCQGSCVPLVGQYVGEPFRKIARNGGVKLASYKWASKVEPIATVAGVKSYGASHWSSYA